jgi:hypothetical protein
MRRCFPSALGMLTVAALVTAPVAAEEPRPSPEARVHFKAGVAALKRRRWDEAYREFKQAYAITPRWTILGNLGIAAQHLERDGEAIDSMEQYLERGRKEISAAEKAEVRETLDLIRAGIAEVTLEAPGTFSIVDIRAAEYDVINEYGPFEERVILSVRAGQHTFKVEQAGVEVPAWSVTLLAGDAATHAFVVEPERQPPVEEAAREEPQPASAPEQPGRDVVAPSLTAPYVLWGLGAAGAGATTVMVLHARGMQLNADRNFAERCPFGATGINGCDNITDDSRRAARWRTAGLVTGVGALGVLVTGTVLYFLTGDSTTSQADVSNVSLQPWAGATGLGVAGMF